MIPWGWVFAAYLVGCIMGFLLAAMCAAAKNGDRDVMYPDDYRGGSVLHAPPPRIKMDREEVTPWTG